MIKGQEIKKHGEFQLDCVAPLVKVINGEIVAIGQHGKLTIFNNNFEILKTFDGTDQTVVSLAGNEKFVAIGVWSGVVQYYSRSGDKAPKVSKS